MIRIGTQIEPPSMWIGPMLTPPSASEVPIAIPNSRTGSDHSTSRVLAITASTQPL